MLFTFTFFILNFAIIEIARGEQQQQRLVKNAQYDVVGWRPEYTCYFHNPSHCVWSKDGRAFTPSQHGYNYHSRDNCSIIGHSGRVNPLTNISCVGYINRNTTVINAELNQNVDLNCQSTTAHTKCGWKRNNATVPIDGRFSYTSNHSRDCSIRIRNIQGIDFGKWTCTYLSRNAEIIALYSINTGPINDEPQRIVESPIHHTLGWSHTYACRFHNPQHCLWLNHEKQFDPTQYGYFYQSKDKCSIKANDYSLDKLHDTHGDISCIGYTTYNSSVIDVGLGQNVELRCQSTSRFTSCVWTRNEAAVLVGGKYSSYISNPIASNDCSIRLNNIKQIDIGQWTCSDQSPDNKITEIIAVFTLSLNNKNLYATKSEGKAAASTSGDATSQTSLSTSVIALTVCTSALILLIVGYIWKKKCKPSSSSPIESNLNPVYDTIVPPFKPALGADNSYSDASSAGGDASSDGYLSPIRSKNNASESTLSTVTNSPRSSDDYSPQYEEIGLLK